MMDCATRNLTRIGKVNAVLNERYCCVVAKWELSNTAKLSVFKSVFVPIIAYGHESWVITEIILSQVQAAVIVILRSIHCATLCDKVRSCKIRRALNVEPLLRFERSQLRWFSHVSRMLQERLARQALPDKPTGK